MNTIAHFVVPVLFSLLELLSVPPGWDRVPADTGSFGSYVQFLLFEPGDSTYFWDGRVEIYHPVAAVHPLPNLTENQQCADFIP